MIILGIDPGYAILGWGALEYTGNKFRTLGYGAVTTEPDLRFERRLQIIHDDLSGILKEYHPEAMAVEKLFFTNNRTTGIGVAEARGVALLSAAQHHAAVYEYTPMQVKQAVVGYGKAVKKQVMEMTRVLLHLDEIPKPDDTADALAIAICHAHCVGSGRRLLEYCR